MARTPVDGIYVMMKEVVDNSVDEFIMGVGKKIEIRRDGETIEVRDYGRGIPTRQGHRVCEPDQYRRQIQRRRLPVFGRT